MRPKKKEVQPTEHEKIEVPGVQGTPTHIDAWCVVHQVASISPRQNGRIDVWFQHNLPNQTLGSAIVLLEYGALYFKPAISA